MIIAMALLLFFHYKLWSLQKGTFHMNLSNFNVTVVFHCITLKHMKVAAQIQTFPPRERAFWSSYFFRSDLLNPVIPIHNKANEPTLFRNRHQDVAEVLVITEVLEKVWNTKYQFIPNKHSSRRIIYIFFSIIIQECPI